MKLIREELQVSLWDSGNNYVLKTDDEIIDMIIGGYEADVIIGILPQLKDSFRQRKTYYEYYFDETELELTLETLDELSNKFTIVLDYEDLTIKVS